MPEHPEQEGRIALAPWVPVAHDAWRLAIAALVVVNVVNAYSLTRQPWLHEGYLWFLLDSEANPGTWLSSILLFVAAALAIVCRVVDTERLRPFWLGCAAVLTVASVEEIAAVHERLDAWLGSELAGTGSLPVAWVGPGVVVVAVLAIVAWRARPNLPVATRRWLVAGVGVYLLGALGVEALGGLWASSVDRDNVTYYLLTTVEENLEMVGTLVLWSGLWQHALAASADRPHRHR